MKHRPHRTYCRTEPHGSVAAADGFLVTVVITGTEETVLQEVVLQTQTGGKRRIGRRHESIAEVESCEQLVVFGERHVDRTAQLSVGRHRYRIGRHRDIEFGTYVADVEAHRPGRTVERFNGIFIVKSQVEGKRIAGLVIVAAEFRIIRTDIPAVSDMVKLSTILRV